MNLKVTYRVETKTNEGKYSHAVLNQYDSILALVRTGEQAEMIATAYRARYPGESFRVVEVVKVES